MSEKHEKQFGIGEVDLRVANAEAAPLDAIETIQWAYEKFGSGLYMSTSYGVESALMFDLVGKSGLPIPGVTVDTMFRFGATKRFVKQIAARYPQEVHSFSPTDKEFREAKQLVEKDFEEEKGPKVYQANVDQFNRLVKLEPMRRAVELLGITALISGVRGHQNDNRASMRKLEHGKFGELRVHPVIDWGEGQARKYFRNEDLLRHPLWCLGWYSVGDWPLTQPGSTRAKSRAAFGPRLECGLH